MRNRFAFMIAVFLLGAPGCLYHGYYPNGYYGGGPSVLPAQPWTGYPNGPVYQQPSAPIYQPGGPIYQPGGNSPTPLNGGTPFYPTTPGTGGQPAGTNDPQTYGNGGNNNSAPPFNPDPKSVPDPGDAGDLNRAGPGASRQPLITPTTGANAPRKDLTLEYDPVQKKLPRGFDEEPVAATDEDFMNPIVPTAGSADGNVQQANAQRPAKGAGPKPYAHDRNFAWIQGVVEYDETNNYWVLMYDDNPQSSDQFGGELALAIPDDALPGYRLRAGSILRIEGSIDDTMEDARHKPVFQVSKVKKL